MTGRRRLAAVPETPRRGTAVVRVSKTRGRPDLISPELQRTAIADYAARSGIVVDEWVEVLDESASADRSPWWRTLDQVIEQVERGERDVVLVWKYSRAARHRRRWAVAIDRIEVAGGTLESATEGLDTTTSTGRLARGMLSELNAWESEVKGEQWRETQDRRRALGLPHGGHPRFGYTYDRATGYTVHPEQGPMLAELYRRYLAGEGHTGLARLLNARGVPPMRGSRRGWSVQAVIRMLDSGFGAGMIVQPREQRWLPGAHDPVITEKEWAAYQRARRERWDRPARVSAPSYPLTGLVKCGLCGLAMVATSDRRYGPGYMYRCTGKATGRLCQGPWVTRAQVERHVLAWLEELVADDLDKAAATKTARAAAAVDARLERKTLKAEAGRLTSSVDRARELLVDGTLTRAEYAVEKDRLDARLAEIERRLDQLQTEVEWLTGPMLGTARSLLGGWPRLPVRHKRDLLATLIRRVEVRPGARGAQDLRVLPVWLPEPEVASR